MLKTLRRIMKQDAERFRVPRGVQDIIPVQEIYPDGIFKVGKNKYSKSFRFDDINYKVASDEDKEAMFLQYCEILNSLDTGATTKLTLNNRRINRRNFEKEILCKKQGDELDEYRQEFNDMLLEKATGSNAIIQDKYLTISVYRKDVIEARAYFDRMEAELEGRFGRLGSGIHPVELEERLRILHGFFRRGEEEAFFFDLTQTRAKGHDFRDYVCPDSYENSADYCVIGGRDARTLFLKEYASYVSDTMVTDLIDRKPDMMLSIDIVPVPTDEAVKEVEQRLLGVETNITNWQRRQNMNNNFSAVVPYDMDQERKESKEILSDITNRDQRMFLAVITLVITAGSLEELNMETEAIMAKGREKMCQFGVLRYQQLDGMKTALPIGVRKIDSFRTLITESLAVFNPFRVQEIRDAGGIYYGVNVISKDLIIADRSQYSNGNMIALGSSGSGKSMLGKGEVIQRVIRGEGDVLIIDPEREYGALVKALGGEVVTISATSSSHINALDMGKDYGEVDPVIDKTQFILSLCEQIITGHRFSKGQQSIIDRCTESVYRYYKQGNYQGTPPTLMDFREELLRQPEPEAKALALELEIFTKGSLGTFAKQTNVNTDSRLICYDIFELGDQLRAVGMLVILDSILNRITQNRMKGRQTFILIDEIYLLFMHEYSAQFLFKLWKRVRKYGAFCTGITQNVEDMLQSHTARTMLANSEFIIMLNQAGSDREELARLLNISKDQMSYITDAEPGHGLIKAGSSLVPFENKWTKNKLYYLMTTRPGENAIEE